MATVALVAAVSAASATPSFAHRLDELFQAARVTLQSDRVVVDLDLAPGIQVAPQVIDALDADGNGVISEPEGLDFARRVVQQSRVSVDDTALSLSVTAHDEPAVARLRGGAGVIHVQAQASLHSTVAEGGHVVRYRNGFDPVRSLYAANATLPTDRRIVIREQERHEDQRALAIRFETLPRRKGRAALVMGLFAALLLLGRWRRYGVSAFVGKAVTVFLGTLLMTSSLAALQTDTGTVTGRVADETGGVLPGVAIEVEHDGRAVTALSGPDGRFRVDGVAFGPSTVTFRLINFRTVRRQLLVQAGAPTTVAVVMGLAASADIVVTGSRTFRNVADLPNPAENLVGIASAASQGAITSRQLEGRPMMRPAEVLEAVPGLIASQHSGEGKANQYYLRGFNLDHGSDFATTIAGIPINVPTGGHFHGYSDTNSLIPELVSGLQFKKGPYFAEDGDFSAAGSANVSYVNALDRPIVAGGAGGQGWERLLAAASPRLGSGHLLAAVELTRNDGPWVVADALRKGNAIVRYSVGDAREGFSVTAQGYRARWHSTDQAPARAVAAGEISRFDSIDPTDAGRTFQYSVVLDGQRASTSTSTRATAYVVRYGLNLLNNFTYFLTDPENGDQFEQVDRRWVTGGRVTVRRLARVFGTHVELAAGTQIRHDAVGELALFNTRAGARLSSVRHDTVDETSLGAFSQADIDWGHAFRTTFGLRGDLFDYRVRSDNPLNSGSGAPGLLSPKFTAVLGPWGSTEFYVNAGYGFHSNDARGASISVDPRTGDPAQPVNLLTRARGAEIGLRTVRIKGVQSTMALWYLDFDSELLFVGDAATTEAGRPSRRTGVEWANYARIAPGITTELDVSFSRARFTDTDPLGNRIPGALDRVISAAVTFEPASRVFGSVRLRHFGPRPLIEDATVRSTSTSIWNSEVGVRVTPRLRLMVELFNVLDSQVADVDYYYASRLPGEPPSGVEDIHTHPSLPRSARLSLKVSF
ncbi:MAG: TonB-dependent receptor [Vicinamibacterales bacterium]